MPVPTPSSANEFIEQRLDECIEDLEQHFSGHAMALSGPLMEGVDNIVRNVVERRHEQGPPLDRLIFVLTTSGGYIEVVRRIVDTLRKHYSLVDFIVPDYAYSAGTVLVMSGDAIHMDYYSRLGPIDPQVESPADGRLRPALGYLDRYDSLIQKARDGTITMAEVQLLISGFDQAELHEYEQARELSIALLKEWLAKYKFKNWLTTETRKKRVTEAMRTRRASTIARQLNDTKKWHSHGHGISRDVLERDLKLKTDDFEADAGLNRTIRGYHALLDDYMVKQGDRGVVHAKGQYSSYWRNRGA
ncbi:MAG: serine dehydrogenasease [Actinobacteria bacterium]|nr:serine dehydrogenasease [Actinomycetota bacterium]